MALNDKNKHIASYKHLTPLKLEILYQDEDLVAINKPHGLLVHRTKLADDANEFALQILRDQIEKHVFPIHRLDRKTGGVLLFGLNEDINRTMQQQFATRNIKKEYLAIVRGFTRDGQTIDYALKKDNGMSQNAITNYTTLDRTELDIPFGAHQTSRYSLIKVNPLTGRFHQIRKHLAHIHHPIICDRPHGDNKQNKLFKEKFGLMTMMLHALELQFVHPETGDHLKIEAYLQSEFKRMIDSLGFNYSS